MVDVKDTQATPAASVSMLVTSTPYGPATDTHSKTCSTAKTTFTDTTPASTNDEVNAPLTLTVDQKDIPMLT